MKRILLGGVAAAWLCALSPSLAGAASPPLYGQCPAVGADSGCQFVVVASDGGQQLLTDSGQMPYDTTEDALVGVQNNSSKPLSSIPLSSAGSSLFGFESDGICNPGNGLAAPGCVIPPVPPATANTPCPAAGGSTCSFPPPPGEGNNYIDPGGSPVNTFPNGDQQNGYEGPTSWFTSVSPDTSSGVVNFSPAIPPGGSTYFGLEEPPSGNITIGAPSTIVSTTLTGGGSSGSSIKVTQGTPVSDAATITTSSGAPATGSVSYTAFTDPACKTPAAAATTAPVGTPSPAQTLPVGTFYWQASYGGDSQNAPTTSACNEVLTVLAPTSVTTALTAAVKPPITGQQITVAPGTAVTDVAHVAGPLAASATGTVTYALFKDASCKVPAGNAGAANVTAGGNAGPSLPQKLSAGKYYWQATYSGDNKNAGSVSACGSEVLAVASSTHLGLPKAKKCVSRRKFIIHVRTPKGQKAATGTVYINGKFKQNVTFGSSRKSTINLKGLPKGRFTVAVFITAQSGLAFTDHRRYKTCTPKGR